MTIAWVGNDTKLNADGWRVPLRVWLCCGTHCEHTQAAAVQLGEGLAADVGHHVHGPVGQQQEPGLRQSQEVLRLVFYLHTSKPRMKLIIETGLCTLLFLACVEISHYALDYQ